MRVGKIEVKYYFSATQKWGLYDTKISVEKKSFSRGSKHIRGSSSADYSEPTNLRMPFEFQHTKQSTRAGNPGPRVKAYVVHVR